MSVVCCYVYACTANGRTVYGRAKVLLRFHIFSVVTILRSCGAGARPCTHSHISHTSYITCMWRSAGIQQLDFQRFIFYFALCRWMWARMCCTRHSVLVLVLCCAVLSRSSLFDLHGAHKSVFYIGCFVRACDTDCVSVCINERVCVASAAVFCWWYTTIEHGLAFAPVFFSIFYVLYKSFRI